jgi:threonine/homoserine efflux transporter RhtA
VELKTSVGAVQESWYIKAYLELGVFGLAIAVALLGTLIYRAARVHMRLRDSRLKIVSAAILALLGWVLIYSLKAQYFDLDPINIYFWLFAGILMGLPRLERQEVVEPPEPEAEPVPVEA